MGGVVGVDRGDLVHLEQLPDFRVGLARQGETGGLEQAVVSEAPQGHGATLEDRWDRVDVVGG